MEVNSVIVDHHPDIKRDQREAPSAYELYLLNQIDKLVAENRLVRETNNCAANVQCIHERRELRLEIERRTVGHDTAVASHNQCRLDLELAIKRAALPSPTPPVPGDRRRFHLAKLTRLLTVDMSETWVGAIRATWMMMGMGVSYIIMLMCRRIDTQKASDVISFLIASVGSGWCVLIAAVIPILLLAMGQSLIIAVHPDVEDDDWNALSMWLRSWNTFDADAMTRHVFGAAVGGVLYEAGTWLYSAPRGTVIGLARTAASSCANACSRSGQGIGDDDCRVCYTNKINCILLPCLHLAICINCETQLQQRLCPICRAAIVSAPRVFRS